MIKNQLLLSFVLIIIILIINFYTIEKFTIFETKKETIKQDYVGPIIFLQKDNENISFSEIGKYPINESNPSINNEFKFASKPNIVNIPRGKVGTQGMNGVTGINLDKSWISSDIKQIDSDNLEFEIENINFNSLKNTINDINPLCIIKQNEFGMDYCIDRATIIGIINSFNE